MRPRRIHIAHDHEDAQGYEAETAGGAPRERRLPALKSTLIATSLMVAAVVALAATNFYLTLDSDELASWIEPRASAALNRPVSVGEAGVSLWPRPSVRVTDVSVGNLPDFDGPMLAHVGAARLDVSWLPLIVGKVQVRRVLLEGPRLYLAVDAKGTSNFGDFVPREESPPQSALSAPIAFRVGEIELSDGTLTYFDAEGGRSLVVSGAEAVADLHRDEEGTWRSTVAARSDSLLVRIAGVGREILRSSGPTVLLAVRGGSGHGSVEIDEGYVAFAEDTLAVYGALSVGGPEPTFDVLFTNEGMSAGFLTALLPTATHSDLLPRVEGRLGVLVQLHGAGGEPPSLRGAVRLDDLAIRVRGEPMVEHVSGVVALTPDTISFDSLSGHFAGGPFELSGVVARRAGLTAFVARGEPDLDALDRLGLLPEGATLSGNAEVYMSVAGPSSGLDSLAVAGMVELRGMQLEHTRLGVAIYVPDGEVSFVGREARWSELSVLVGRDRLMTSGRIEDVFDLWPGGGRAPVFEVSLTGPRLDLNSAFPARDTASEATYAQLALAHLGGRPVDGRAASVAATSRGLSRPERLPARGTAELRLDTLLFRRYALHDLAGTVELTDSVLTVADASFQAWGGRGQGSLRLGVGGEADEPFALTLLLDDVEAQPFLSMMSPVGEAISGSLDLELEVSGSTDASLLPVGRDLTGRLALALENGAVGGTGVNLALADFLGAEAWTDVAFTRWEMDIGIRERVLDVRQAELHGEPGEVVFSGPLRLDGSADWSMGVLIPSDRLRGVTLRRTGIGQRVLEQLRAAGGSLDLGLSLSGWLQAPTLEPDASHAVALARIGT